MEKAAGGLPSTTDAGESVNDAANNAKNSDVQQASASDADRAKIDILSSVDYPIDWDQLLLPSANPAATTAAALLRSRIEHRLYEHETDFLTSLLKLYNLRTTKIDAVKSNDAGNSSSNAWSIGTIQVDILHAILRAAQLRLLLNDFLKALKSFERFYHFARRFQSQTPKAADLIGQPNLLRNFHYGIAICYDELNLVHLAREAYNLALQKQQIQNPSVAADLPTESFLSKKVDAGTSSAFVQTVHYRLALLYQDAGLEKLSRKHLLWLRRLVLAASPTSTESTLSATLSTVAHSDNTSFSVQACVLRVDFQLGKLYEKSGKVEQAKKTYEEILQKCSSSNFSGSKQNGGPLSLPALPIFRASVLKQLGWLAFMHSEFGETLSQRAQAALSCLKQSIELNEEDGQTWYFIGRCYSALGMHVRDAYAAYKNSIDKSDANADTWCSIGILYQQQKQQVDALQAYVCAVQLEEGHHYAWLNLGMLYESVVQYRDALYCFKRCIETLPDTENASTSNNGDTAATLQPQSSVGVNLLSWCQQRTVIFDKLIQLQGDAAEQQQPHTLAHVEQALTTHMPFAAEMLLTTQCDSTKRRRALLEPDALRPIPDELSEDYNWDLLSAYQARITSGSSSASHQQQQQLMLNEDQVRQAQGLCELHELRDAIQAKIEQRNKIGKQLQQLESELNQQKQQNGAVLDELHPSNCMPNNLLLKNSSYAQVEAENLFADLEEAIAENFNEFETAETISTNCRSRYELAFDPKRQIQKLNPPPLARSSAASSDESSDSSAPAFIDDADDLRPNLCYTPINVVRNSIILPGQTSGSSYLSFDDEEVASSSSKWPNLDAYLLPLAPRKSVDTRRDAMSAELERFCMSHPVVIVRNICTALKLDMSLFSTKSIVDRDSQLQIEARVQLKQPVDSNLDTKTGKRTWFVSSRTTFMTLNAYGEYQASLFAKALSDESATPASGGTGRQRGGAAAGGASKKGRQSEKQKDAAAAAATSSVADDTDLMSTASSSSRKTSTAKGKQQQQPQPQPTAASTATGAAKNKKQRRSSTAAAAAAAAAATNLAAALSSTKVVDDEASQASTAETISSVTGLPAQQRPLKFEKIWFCTNCDLSDMDKWSLQLAELQKLPRFLRVESTTNMLTHLDHKVLGVNTPQLFMKVPGCRTTGHQQPLMFCSVNINIGPGECEWFCVPNEYWPRLRALCTANGVDYMHGSWWPDAEQLRAANIPVYRFTQLPGDLVWINPGTIQWVYSSGWNNNIAWNVAPFDARQLALSLERYEWNKMQNYKSLFPMMSLVWSLARNVSIREPLLYRMLKYAMRKCLIQSECIAQRLQLQYKCKVIDQQREEGEQAYYCEVCEVELFNYLFVKEDKSLGKFLPHCLQCASADDSLLVGSYLAIQQYSQQQLSDWYDAFQFAS